MVEEATVDAYGDEEQLVGFYTMIVDHVETPFEVEVFGLTVTVSSSISSLTMPFPWTGVGAGCFFLRAAWIRPSARSCSSLVGCSTGTMRAIGRPMIGDGNGAAGANFGQVTAEAVAEFSNSDVHDHQPLCRHISVMNYGRKLGSM
ncbi:hypothetical protein [Nocardia niigatensis]|uniref:hypothetical protein n=1 Tax=Nocardia niigatensis TaxID=209249 RepID=UPI0012F62C06|nr:hypothetical protein [Nocardia niigatensis]